MIQNRAARKPVSYPLVFLPAQLLVRAATPLPPGINASYKVVTVPVRPGSVAYGKGKQTVHRLGATKELEQFKESAAWLLCSQENYYNWEAIKFIVALAERQKKVPLKVCLWHLYDTLWKSDIDGGDKHVIDAVFKHIGINDNHILDCDPRKRISPNPRCLIEVYTLSAQDLREAPESLLDVNPYYKK